MSRSEVGPTSEPEQWPSCLRQLMALSILEKVQYPLLKAYITTTKFFEIINFIPIFRIKFRNYPLILIVSLLLCREI